MLALTMILCIIAAEVTRRILLNCDALRLLTSAATVPGQPAQSSVQIFL
jgi:hypothetical protein